MTSHFIGFTSWGKLLKLTERKLTKLERMTRWQGMPSRRLKSLKFDSLFIKFKHESSPDDNKRRLSGLTYHKSQDITKLLGVHYRVFPALETILYPFLKDLDGADFIHFDFVTFVNPIYISGSLSVRHDALCRRWRIFSDV